MHTGRTQSDDRSRDQGDTSMTPYSKVTSTPLQARGEAYNRSPPFGLQKEPALPTLGLQPPDSERINSCCLSHSVLWCFVPAAPGTEDRWPERRPRWLRLELFWLQGGHSCHEQDGTRFVHRTHLGSERVLAGNDVGQRTLQPRALLTWVSSSVTSKFSLFRCLFTNVMRDCQGKETWGP